MMLSITLSTIRECATRKHPCNISNNKLISANVTIKKAHKVALAGRAVWQGKAEDGAPTGAAANATKGK